MRRTRIKICGITRLSDALAAVDAGVDALGFVFYPPSPRALALAEADAILGALPPLVTRVGLVVDPDEQQLAAVARLDLDLLQFHGTESAAACSRSPKPHVKAIAMRPGVDLCAEARRFEGARALLLDTHDPSLFGGTGRVFDWERVPMGLSVPLILAGGLDAANVGAAIRQVQPYAVDVSGGVEAAKGIKDHDKIRHFVAAVRSADELASTG